MKKQTLLFSLIFTFVFAFSAVAQEKMLTIDEIFDPAKRVAFGGRPTFVQWTRDGAAFLQVKPGAGGLTLVRVDPKTGAETPYVVIADIAAALQKADINAQEAQAAANSFPSAASNPAQTAVVLNTGKDLVYYDLTAKTAKRLTNDAAEELEADFSPDGKLVSFVKGNNLYVVEVANGKTTQLTKDGAEKIFNGYLVWVYEEELYGRGNKRGYWWSPDSTAVAFLRTDESPVQNFAVINHQNLYQTVENTPYPKAGAPNPLVKLGMVNVGDAKTVFADTSAYKPEDFLISRVAWSPDSRAAMYQAQNREQTFLDLNTADRATGKTTLVFKETSPAWVEVIDNATYLKDGTMIWQSAARTGWKHLYHFDKNGKLIRPVTSGEWEVTNFHGVDEKNGFVYFSSTKDGHINTNAYRVKLDGTGLQRLTQGDGWHSVSFNSTFTHFVDNWSDINTPPQTRLYRADGTLERVINENKVDVLGQYKLGKPEFMKVKNKEGFEMEAMMLKPANFDPSKKYPVMQFTYAGPHAPQVRNAWGGATGMWYQMLAQQGYIIWVCDNRTASGKGEVSVYPVYGRMGETELADIEDGLNYLKTLPYIDASRVGISGWSYGGFMTSYALTNSKSFKIGIAGGSVTDWALYDSIYTERYMKTPQNNPDGYKRTSVINAAPNLHGKILLVHGVIDDNVHLQNTMQLVYELQKAGKQFDLMLYPTARHGVTNPLQVKHMRQKMTDFILANL
jgi:dipeptidyl-peptidase 4